MSKPKILVLHDTPTEGPKWAYARRTESLARYAPDDLDITRASHPEAKHWDLSGFDLVTLMDYMAVAQWKRLLEPHGIPLVCSFNKDSRSRHEDWLTTVKYADWVIVSNENRFRADGIHPKTCCIANGVDLETFKPVVSIEDRPHKCVWTGGTGHRKKKNYYEVLEPLKPHLEERGFSHSFRPVTKICPEQVMDSEGMRNWYNSASYWLCASDTEGNPSTLHESMACGCIPIMTNVGNCPEIIEDGVNGLIVEPTIDSFLNALEYARKHRKTLSANALKTIQYWGYGKPGYRAEYFYALFRRICRDGVGSLRPFSYREVRPKEI